MKINQDSRGQALVETLLIVVFLTIVVFAAIQFCIITFVWLRANEASQAGLRCAIVSKGSTQEGADSEEPQKLAKDGVLNVMGLFSGVETNVWDKVPQGVRNIDHSSGNDAKGAQIRMFSIHTYYPQKLMFSKFFGSIASSGYLKISNRNTSGAAHCRMIKSPDWRFYNKAYPEGDNFNEESN